MFYVQSLGRVLCLFHLIAILDKIGLCCPPHFAEWEIEAQRGKEIIILFHWQEVGLALESFFPGFPYPQSLPELGIKHRVLAMLGKHSITELHPQPPLNLFSPKTSMFYHL
jgi:hypothetical protein